MSGKAWYREYLKSLHWQWKRDHILFRADGYCEWCGRHCPRDPHPELDGHCCGDPWCDYCAEYFDEDGLANDLERQTLEIHHLTYERVGRELDSDLVALCWSCHEETWDKDRDTWRTFHARQATY